MLESEPRIADILGFHGFSASSYMMTCMALERARYRSEQQQLRASAMPPVEAANTAFYVQNRVFVDILWDKWTRAEGGLGLATRGVAW